MLLLTLLRSVRLEQVPMLRPGLGMPTMDTEYALRIVLNHWLQRALRILQKGSVLYPRIGIWRPSERQRQRAEDASRILFPIPGTLRQSGFRSGCKNRGVWVARVDPLEACLWALDHGYLSTEEKFSLRVQSAS